MLRAQCEACHELALATVAIADGVVVVTCTACSVATRVTPTATAPAPATTIATPSPTCPKCGEPRPDVADGQSAKACARCGLAADRMAAFTEAREAAVAVEVRAAWDRVVESWDDPDRHDELLRLVATHSAYPWAAGRYRDAARSRPEKDDPVAATQLDRIRRAAEGALRATAAVDGDRTTARRTIVILVLVLVVMVAGLLYGVLHTTPSDDGGLSPAPALSPPAGTR